MQICKVIKINVCLYLITLVEYTYRDSVPRKQMGKDSEIRVGGPNGAHDIAGGIIQLF